MRWISGCMRKNERVKQEDMEQKDVKMWTVEMHMCRAITAALLIIGSFYTLAVVLYQPEKIWDWLNTLVGTGLSFSLAILGGIYLFRFQNSASERAENETLKNLLTAEMSDLTRILNDDARMPLTTQSGQTREILIAFTQPLIIEKAASSGLFKQNETENLLHLARKIRMHNFKADHMMGLIRINAEETFLLHAADNLEQTRDAAVAGLKQVAEQLQLTLNDKYPDGPQPSRS